MEARAFSPVRQLSFEPNMSTATVTQPVPKPELRRELGLASATTLVAGECIAVGIFLTPAGMRKASPSAGAAILTPGYPFTSAVYLTFIALTLVLLVLHAPRESALGVVVVLAGVPVYETFLRKPTSPMTPQASAEKASS